MTSRVIRQAVKRKKKPATYSAKCLVLHLHLFSPVHTMVVCTTAHVQVYLVLLHAHSGLYVPVASTIPY